MTLLSEYLRILILCVVVALITKEVWGGSYPLNFAISLTYGFVAFSTRKLMLHFKPGWSHALKYTVTILATIVLGSINVWWWVSGFGAFPALTGLISSLILAIFLTTLLYQFYLNREQSHQLETERREAELQQAQQQKTLVQSQLKVLQSQIEPHFLFNTLANLKMLIRHDPKKAELLLDNFSDLLRFSLNKSRSDYVSLKDELSSLESYLAIQQIRLGERLQYKVELAETVNPSTAVPPLLIQPLVENAIFHGIEPSPKGGLVSLKVATVASQWVIEVEDNGIGLQAGAHRSEPSKHNGLALNNIKERLATLYQGKGKLQISSNKQGGVTARLEFPCAQ
ncbi:sensor histidine kinase [Microbulbifer variabilis]|uniref:sensor histidine kinase n=1 Tax=Microbulbifer variabilis TaxID=266805 RepID=UPI001CFCE0FD|nr:histidine kinase [Microbulbifer variabilis]